MREALKRKLDSVTTTVVSTILKPGTVQDWLTLLMINLILIFQVMVNFWFVNYLRNWSTQTKVLMVSLDLKSDRIKFKMVWWVLYLLHMYFLSEFFFSSHQPKTQAYNRSNNIIITLTFLIGSYYRYWSISNQPQLKCHWLPHHHHHHIFHPTYCMYYYSIPLDLSHPILWSPPPLIPPWSLTNQTQATTRLSAGCWRESGSLLNFWEPCCTVQVHRFLWMFAWWYIYIKTSHTHLIPSQALDDFIILNYEESGLGDRFESAHRRGFIAVYVL